MKAYERLLKYVIVRTPSDESSETVPSSACQFDLAKLLLAELKELGVKNAYMDDKSFVYGKIPANPGYENCTKIGFMAHMDTVADFCDHDITPVVIENFDGEDFELGTSGRFLNAKQFPHLPSLKGRTLITTDGTTVLGADDKAGIAEIMTVVERLMKNEIPHGPIRVAFTPDEEIGTGSHSFNVPDFDAEFAYTVDGGAEGESSAATDIEDGEHTVEVTLEGGTGKASVTSPATIKVSGDSVTAVIEWSSPHYDYMIVEGEKYLPVNEDGNSVFEIPVLSFDKPMTVIADTTAMSEPHEIEYTLTFDSSSVK